MKKNALRKDFFREIQKSFGRFLSILLIVALGVSILVGLIATQPDMVFSGDTYADAGKLMDIKVVGTFGLTEEDAEEILKLDSIKDVEGSYSTDVLCNVGDNMRVLHVMAQTERMNQVEVTEGRMPENEKECLMDSDFLAESGYQVGDMIRFESGTEDELTDTLKETEYKIVGAGNTAMYFSFERGSSLIGNGTVTGFAVVLPDAFDLDVYTEIYATVEGAFEKTAFTEEYETIVESAIDEIEEIQDARCEVRRNDLIDEIQVEIDDARDELNDKKAEAEAEIQDAEVEISDGEKELADAKDKITDGKEQIADGKEQIADGKEQIADGKDKIADAKEQIADGKEQIADGKTQLEDGKKQIENGKKEIADGKKEIADGKKEIEKNKKEIEDGKKQLEDGRKQIADGKKQLEAGKEELEAGKKELESNKKTLLAQKAECEAGLQTLSEQKPMIEAGLAQLYGSLEYLQGEELAAAQAKIAELEQNLAMVETKINELTTILTTQIAPAEEQIAAAEAQLKAGEEELVKQEQVLIASEKELKEQEKVLEAGEKELLAGEKELLAGEKELLDGEKELLANEKELLDNEKKLLDQEKELLENEQELLDQETDLIKNEKDLIKNEKELKEKEQELLDAEQELADGEKELADGKQELEDAKQELADKIQEGEDEINDAEKEINDLEYPEWYVFDRETLPEYTSYKDNANRIKALATVFPAMFFFVAALISLTSMTRMVEEQRVQIGTLKALGYSKFAIMKKYLYYALCATLGGSALGVLVGEKLFPYVIITAYHTTVYHHITEAFVPYRWGIALAATAIASACTGIATIASCYKELLAQPAILMRPEAPKIGKKTVIEKIPFLWNHLNFSWKSSLRNLFRYKKRFVMTVFGIGGCMGLLMVGYGLRDSISSISKYQYGELQLYDLSVFIDEDMESEDKEALDQFIEENENIEHSMAVNMENVTTQYGDEEVDAYLTVINDLEQIDEFFVFRDRKTKERYVLEDSGVIISEKTANMLNAEIGSEILLTEDGKYPKKVVITDICENYFGHYVYMTDTLYEEIYGKEVVCNSILLKSPEDLAFEKLEEMGIQILTYEDIMSVQYTKQISQSLDDMIVALDKVMILLILVAGMLSFVVLYNLNNINITERRRELATLKVLGFFPMEVGMYVYRENILLTFVGVLFGCGMGRFLHLFTVKTVEVDSAMFGRTVFLHSYLICAGFTILFSIIVNWIMYFKLKQINMVESLKSVE